MADKKNTPTKKRQEATVYVGAVGSEIEYGGCVDTLRNIKIRKGDRPLQVIRATKGFDARNEHIRQFLDSDHGAILLLDTDMSFEPDTLEVLREHGLPYVSGYYMRRQYQPIVPVMFEPNPDGVWPYEIITREPEQNQLHEIGASGWGCVLVHREVFEAVEPLLKGEPFVAEDDMDVWPYDLPTIIGLINVLNETDDMETIKEAALGLRKEFRVLRGLKDNIGSDIRFPFFARQAGYKLFLDASIRPGHVIQYHLSGNDFANALQTQEKYLEMLRGATEENREKWRNATKGLFYE